MSRSLLEQLRNFLTANDVTLVDLVESAEAALAAIDSDTNSMQADLGTIDSDTGTIKSKISTIDGDTGAMRSNMAAMSVDTDALESDMSRGVTNLAGKVIRVGGTTSSGSIAFSKAGMGVSNNARIRMVELSVESASSTAIFNISLDALTLWEGYFPAGSMGRLVLRFGEFWDEMTGTITVSRVVGSATVEAKVNIYYEDLGDDSGAYATA